MEKAQRLLEESFDIREAFLNDEKRAHLIKEGTALYQDHQIVQERLIEVKSHILEDNSFALNTEALQLVSFPEPDLKQWILNNDQNSLNLYYKQAHQSPLRTRSMKLIQQAIGLVEKALAQDLEGIKANPKFHTWAVIRDRINLGLLNQLGYLWLSLNTPMRDGNLQEYNALMVAADEQYGSALKLLESIDKENSARHARMVLYNNMAALASEFNQREKTEQYLEIAQGMLEIILYPLKSNKQALASYKIDLYTLYNNHNLLLQKILQRRLNKTSQNMLKEKRDAYDFPLHRTQGDLGLLTLHEDW